MKSLHSISVYDPYEWTDEEKLVILYIRQMCGREKCVYGEHPRHGTISYNVKKSPTGIKNPTQYGQYSRILYGRITDGPAGTNGTDWFNRFLNQARRLEFSPSDYRPDMIYGYGS